MSKWMDSMIEKYGSEKAVKEKLQEWGSRGGSAEVKKGFASMDKKRHIAVSRKGGKVKK